MMVVWWCWVQYSLGCFDLACPVNKGRNQAASHFCFLGNTIKEIVVNVIEAPPVLGSAGLPRVSFTEG